MELRADVVVVGSGAGGSTVAGELHEAGRSVIVVEAGTQLGLRPGANLRNHFPDEDDLERFGRFIDVSLVHPSNAPEPLPGLPAVKVSHAVGGMMVHWTGPSPEQHPTLERPRCVPAGEWPNLYHRARSLLHVTQDLFVGSERQARLLRRLGELYPELPAGWGPQPMPVAGRRGAAGVRFAGADDLLLRDATDPPAHLRILPGAVVRRLVHRGGRVLRAEVLRRDGGPPLLVEGQVFVVACGTVGTPQLLVGSGIDASPALGRFLMDHPMFVSRVVLADDLRRGVARGDPPFSVWIPVSETRPWHVQIVRFPIGYSPVPPGIDPTETADVFCFTSMEPRARNAILFDSGSVDPFGLPRPRIEMALSRRDVAVLQQAVADQARLVGGIATLLDGWRPELQPLGGSTHLMGSYRMGEADDGASVTDPAGKVWGYENLYLAGNGLFPTPSACNPTLTTVALGLRTASEILQS